MTLINKSTFKFCRALAKNNNREWFHANKPTYQEALANVKEFQASLLEELQKIDAIEKHKMFRIYRDVRFSKDKTPYNPDFRLSFSREGVHRRGGYYLRLAPGNSFVACGFWGPEPKDLKLIRSHIAQDAKPLRKILASKKFKETFGQLEGNQVKSAPQGYKKDDPNIDLLKYKQLVVQKHLPDAVVHSKDLTKEIIKAYKNVHPFFNYMSEILTHDLNGVPLYT
jgi:uncharacterized protein (TIGR02453 family)